MSRETEQRSEQKIPAFARLWSRMSRRLVPIFAVITAFLVGIPLIIITGGDGNITDGLNISARAYTALLESMTGLARNDVVNLNDLEPLVQYAENNPIENNRLSSQARPFEYVGDIGMDNLVSYRAFLDEHPVLTVDVVEDMVERIPTIKTIGETTLLEMEDLLNSLDELESANVRDLASIVADDELSTRRTYRTGKRALSTLSRFWTVRNRKQLLAQLALVDEYGLTGLQRHLGVLQLLNTEGIALDSLEEATIFAIYEADLEDVVESAETIELLQDSNIDNPALLGENIRILSGLYDAELLTAESINDVVNSGELETVLTENLIVNRPSSRRPGTNLLVAPDAGSNFIGITQIDQELPVLYIHLGESSVLFFPGQLETTIVRAIPFIIAGSSGGVGL